MAENIYLKTNHPMKVDLNIVRWGEFKINSIFIVDKGVYLHTKDIKKGDVPYITAKSDANGINSFIRNTPIFKGNAITIEKINLSAYYQSKDFYCSHDVTVIRNDKLNKNNALFICNMISRQGFKYSYGRQAQMNVCKNELIYLPITSKGEPDYAFMEQYMRHKEHEKIENFKNYIEKRICKKFKKVEPLSQKEWKEFKIVDLFDFEKGDQNNMTQIEKGCIPLVSAKKGENGYKDFATQSNKKIYSKNSLTLNNDGDGGAGISFYQPSDYLLDSHVTALFSKKNLSKQTLLFISRSITIQRDKFGHGYSITTNRLKALMIMLPIDKKGQPDYDYMENYMKKLEYEKLTKYLSIKS